MKTIYPAAGGLLLAAALLLAIKGGRNEAPAAADSSSRTAAGPAETSPEGRPRPAARRVPRESETPAAARELELLWARGRTAELLPALDRLSTDADGEHWADVAPVLIRHAADDGRHEVVNYLLATGDNAPAGIRLEIYAAALDNPDEGVRATARLELQNQTGEVFPDGEKAREWIAAHPEAADDGEPEDQ